MPGLYDTFETDISLEKEGIWLDYGDFRVKVGHTGGGNKKYVSFAEKKLKPLRRAIDSGAIDNARARAVMMDIFTKTIIFDWETKIDGEEEWQTGIEDREGSIIEFNSENVLKTLKSLPKLFEDIQEGANSIANFKMEEMEADSKNS